MKQLKITDFTKLQTNLIYPIYQGQTVQKQLSDILNCDLNQIVDYQENEITIINTLNKLNFKTITFIALGDKKQMTTKKIRALAKLSLKDHAAIYFEELASENLSIETITQVFVEAYICQSYQETKVSKQPKEIKNLDIIYTQSDLTDEIKYATNLGKSINYARSISDLPSNLMTPYDLVQEARNIAKEYDLQCQILDKDDLIKLQAGGILAVNQGSDIPAYLICLKYNHNGNQPYTAIVGKGITFDSGGYNIKNNSYGMKYDMCGSGDVLGIIKALAANQVQANVYGIIPTTENLISGKGYKPQDVITMLSKKTVEIVSTDAEGRLILADALTYSQQLPVSEIIDLATLTGACIMALGDLYTGVFSNDDQYYQKFAKSMAACDELGWRLPINQQYMEKLKSNSADFKNSAGKPGAGASIAATFLSQFVAKDIKWIHLDIAGTADNDGTQATGAMIRSIVHFITNKDRD